MTPQVPTSALLAAVTADESAISLPPGAFQQMSEPAQVYLGGVEVVAVQGATPGDVETWQVRRGVNSSAVPHPAGTVVEPAYSPGEPVDRPGGIAVTLGARYTPNADVTYHFLKVGGSDVVIAPPVKAGGPQVGDDVRLVITQGAEPRKVTFTTGGGAYVLHGLTVGALPGQVTSAVFAFDGQSWIRV